MFIVIWIGRSEKGEAPELMAENTQMGLMEVQQMLAVGGNGDGRRFSRLTLAVRPHLEGRDSARASENLFRTS